MVRAPFVRADVDGLAARVCRALDGRAVDVIECDVAGVDADAVAVEALARLQLEALRRGCRARLLNASPELLELVALAGLGEVLPG